MPLYEYRCTSCGRQEEFLQKWSDAPMTVCTACGRATLSKMLTAAGFQLKGSGWYATDFKNSGQKPAPKGDAKSDAKADSKADTKGDASPGEAKSAVASEAKKDTTPPPSAASGNAASS